MRAIIASRRNWRHGALAAVLAAWAVAGHADDTVRQNAEQLEKLRARIQALQQSLEADRSRQGELRNQLEDAERHAAELTSRLGDLDRQVAAQAAQQRRTQQQQAQAQADLQRQRRALAAQVRASYIIGQRGETQLVLNQDRSQRLTRVMTYYDYLARARAARIHGILGQVDKLAALAELLRRQGAALQATRDSQKDTLQALDAARAQRRQAIAALGSRIAGEEGRLRQMQSDEKDLAHLIDQLRSALADVPADLGDRPFGQLRGKLPWPVRGRLLARFGDPKAGGRLKWNGIWIARPEGDPVRAVAKGRVAYVGWMHAYGLIAVLEHEGGYYSLYGHNQNVAVAVGDWVQAGDTIATVGSTGGHVKSGLYFELRRGTDPINPRPWFHGKGTPEPVAAGAR